MPWFLDYLFPDNFLFIPSDDIFKTNLTNLFKYYFGIKNMNKNFCPKIKNLYLETKKFI